VPYSFRHMLHALRGPLSSWNVRETAPPPGQRRAACHTPWKCNLRSRTPACVVLKGGGLRVRLMIEALLTLAIPSASLPWKGRCLEAVCGVDPDMALLMWIPRS